MKVGASVRAGKFQMKTCLRFYEIKKLILGIPCDALITPSDRIVQGHTQHKNAKDPQKV
jgi:hypothetical protein